MKKEIERINESIKEDKPKDNSKYESKTAKVFGVSIRRVFGYMVIYSFLGYLVEVVYGIITKGVIECRQSFLYGPFSCIYGLGAIAMILPLKKIKTSNKLIQFLILGLIGCTVEYCVSLYGDLVQHVKWWDYSDYFLNINGRTCLYYGIFWGVLGLLLIYVINPRVDNLISRHSKRVTRKNQNRFVAIANIILLLDLIVSSFAADFYQTRVIYEKDIDVPLKDYYVQRYHKIYDNEIRKKFIESIWGNEVMIQTFPNHRIKNNSGDIIFLKDYYPEIKSYYFKVFETEKSKVQD
ncbi:MAG: putative ABC transporter permease [Clostridia bacterium]|nr:putative ABC transporter permease [Clostridia bacterium]